jgi:drug/metabolite transporter (DMT)-like permease
VSVAFHTSWIAAAQMGVLALLVNRDDWFFAGDGSAVAAVAYLAAASAISFSFWFAAVGRIGGDLAGLTSGAIPIVATISGAWLGVADVNARQLLGIAIVTAAVVVAIRAPGIAHRPPEPETSGAARDA